MRAANGRRASVHVDDDGPGIPAEFRARIFGRFERSNDSEGSAGTGLGLAIARNIVAQHGGEIWFEDRPEGGTSFAFSLPVALPAAIARDLPHEARILLCESDPATAHALHAQLSREGYACRIVPDARAARAAMAADGYALLLLDMALDDEDAFALARDVRRAHSPEKLSILMMSSTGTDDGAMPLSLDLVDWIEKPIDPIRLRTAIRTAFRNTHIEHPTADLLDARGIAIPTIIYSAHDVAIDVAGQIDAILVKSRTSLPDLKATIRRVVATRHRE